MRALVTGGAGFIGGGVARALRARGIEVRSFSRREYPELEADGIESFAGDLGTREDVVAAAEDCDVVFHVAALAGYWGPREDYERTNILGTDHVLDACREHEIERLIFTSSPSVTFAGKNQRGVDETEPYPSRFLADYPRTKAIAEQRVRAAASDTFATVSLRPHLVWGPGDPHFLPRLVERAKAGKLKLVGDGSARVDSCTIENAVAAHLAAFDALSPGADCSGKAYFISNGEPTAIGHLIRDLLAAAGLEDPKIGSVPPWAATAVGWGMELLYRWFAPKKEPPVTRFVARQLATDHYFDLTAARRDLGYDPPLSYAEGIIQLADFLSAERSGTLDRENEGTPS